jgi:hypothetical protein
MFINYDMEKTLQRRHNRENAQGLAPINLRITISGKRCDLATGVFCPASYWPAGAKKIVFPSDKKLQVLPEFSAAVVADLNDELDTFKKEVSEIHKRLRKPHPRGPSVPVSVADVRAQVRPGRVTAAAATPVAKKLLEVADEFLKASWEVPVETRLAASTLASYETRRKTLARYLAVEKAPNLLATAVDIPWCRRYERWLVSEEGGYSPLSMRKQINFLQMALSFAVHEGWVPTVTLHGYSYQAKSAPPPALSLPSEEVQMLVQHLPEMDLPARRAVVGWLFCCYTGLSWVDYRHFCRRPVEHLFAEIRADNTTQCWIRMIRQKMKRRKPQGFSVPLFEPAADLLIAWKGRLPHSHGANVNILLHRVEEELGLSQSLTTKLARATFSQMRRDEGYSDEAVAAMMGDTVSVMNRHYSKVSERRIALEMEQLGNRGQMHIAA